MSRSIKYPNVQIDSVHSLAICEEIGHRLQQSFKTSATEHPRHLMFLDRLRRQDFGELPSIVPSFHRIDARGGTYQISMQLWKRAS